MAVSSENGGQPKVTVRCVACKATREISPGEVPAGDVPTCELCFMPMVAVSANAR